MGETNILYNLNRKGSNMGQLQVYKAYHSLEFQSIDGKVHGFTKVLQMSRQVSGDTK